MRQRFLFSFLSHLLILNLVFLQYIHICASNNVKKSVYENRDDNGETTDENINESMDIPTEAENNATCTRRHNSQMHEIRTASTKQFPFMAAIMSQQHEYLCAGSIVSNGLILTTAQCIQKQINYVLLNVTSIKRDNTSVILHIIKNDKFPTYTGPGAGKDVGLIYTEKHNGTFASKLSLGNLTSADSLTDVEALGFGLNCDVGQIKELQYVGLERRNPLNENFYSAYIDCVDTKVTTCFRDVGGPVLYDNQLVGVVVKGQEDCTREISSRYSINKFMIDFLPIFAFKAWLEDRVKKNEELAPTNLMTYPSKPALREAVHVLTSTKTNSSKKCAINIVLLFLNFAAYIYN